MLNLTFKRKMWIILLLSVIGFILLTTLAILSLKEMSNTLEESRIVSKIVREASKTQVILLKIVDDSRKVTEKNVNKFLDNVDKEIDIQNKGIDNLIENIYGTELYRDILWLKETSQKYKSIFYRYSHLKKILFFSNDGGLKNEFYNKGTEVKNEIWLATVRSEVSNLIEEGKKFIIDGSPESSKKFEKCFKILNYKLDEINMSGTFKSVLNQYFYKYEKLKQIRLDLWKLENEIDESIKEVKSRNDVIEKNGRLLLINVQGMAENSKKYSLVAMITGSIVIGGLISLILFFTTNDFLRSLKMVICLVGKVADGDLDIELSMNRKDEIGKLLEALNNMVIKQKQVCSAMGLLSKGDLRYEIEVDNSKKDELRKAMVMVRNDLSLLIYKQIISSKIISSGSANVSDFSKALSRGATESAASLEEISSSLSEMLEQIKWNSENAYQVNRLSSEACEAAEKGNKKMAQMISAMSEISEAGQNINKIIKVIDEIAFQTNLLALNAAVEAARAGQHGKGFAVVAEEVRGLAARCAKAASETAELIEDAVVKTETGVSMANQTSDSLKCIFSKVSEVSDLANEIAAASKEQSEGISQINIGLEQIDEVIQQNTASAEEGASAAKDLSGQAVELMELISKFKISEGVQNSVPGS